MKFTECEPIYCIYQEYTLSGLFSNEEVVQAYYAKNSTGLEKYDVRVHNLKVFKIDGTKYIENPGDETFELYSYFCERFTIETFFTDFDFIKEVFDPKYTGTCRHEIQTN